jgi:hypothetical protein
MRCGRLRFGGHRWWRFRSFKRIKGLKNATDKTCWIPNRGMSSDPPLRLVGMSPAGSAYAYHAVALCSAMTQAQWKGVPLRQQAGTPCDNGASRCGARDGPVQRRAAPLGPSGARGHQ